MFSILSAIVVLKFVITNSKKREDKKKTFIIEIEINISRGHRTIRVLLDSEA